jgi:hypothetical protein
MSAQADLTFLQAFLAKYEDVDAPVFNQLDPMTGLSKSLNNLTTLVEDRSDMAAPLEKLLFALVGGGL